MIAPSPSETPAVDMVALAKKSLGLQEAIPPAAPADATAIGSGCDGNRAEAAMTEMSEGRRLLLTAAAYDAMARYHELMMLANRAAPNIDDEHRAEEDAHHRALAADWKAMAEERREKAREAGEKVPAPCMSGFIAAVGGRP